MVKTPEKPQLVWEGLNSVYHRRGKLKDYHPTERAKVPGGWLVSVCIGTGIGVTFYADPDHRWNGGSLS
jgi:hypothetical protein